MRPALLVSLFKSGGQGICGNFREISLSSIVGKVLDRTFRFFIYLFFWKLTIKISILTKFHDHTFIFTEIIGVCFLVQNDVIFAQK